MARNRAREMQEREQLLPSGEYLTPSQIREEYENARRNAVEALPHPPHGTPTMFSANYRRQLDNPLNVLKANQLDAEMLDSEVHLLLRSQFMNIFKYFSQTSVGDWKPELNAFLHYVILRCSIIPKGATYGQSLQNLTYRSEAAFQGLNIMNKTISPIQRTLPTVWQRYGFVFLSVGVKWAWERLSLLSEVGGWSDYPENNWRRKLWAGTLYTESCYKVLLFVNMIVFLWNGQYVNLIARVLRLRLVYSRASAARAVNFEYLNRQLVWQGLSSRQEFLLSLLPFLNLDKIFGYIRKKMSLQGRGIIGNDASACPICDSSPTNSPHQSNCGHVFCYYCVRSALLENGSFSCQICGTTVKTIKRLPG